MRRLHHIRRVHPQSSKGASDRVLKGVSITEATEAAASVISSDSYILKYIIIFTMPHACHDKFVLSTLLYDRRKWAWFDP